MEETVYNSNLLSSQENEDLGAILLARRQTSFSSVVARLYLSNAKQHQWVAKVTGVVCFVKDFDRRSFYIIAYDMDRKVQVWEQELYSEMVYRNRNSWFHTFEAETEMAGICFVEEEEASHFLSTIRMRLDKMQARERRKSARVEQKGPVHEISLGRLQQQQQQNGGTSRRRKTGLSKSDISAPTSFVHVSGVKASEKGFEMVDNMNEIDPQLRHFLHVAGLSDNILQNPTAKNQIYAFVKENNVIDEMRRSVRAPSHSPVAVTPVANYQPRIASRPVVQQSIAPHRPPAPAPHGPKPTMISTAGGAGPPPPPPPPPPPSTLPGGPPPPPGPGGLPQLPVMHKPVTPSIERKPTASSSSAAPVNLLDQIRSSGGIKSLHKVGDRKMSTATAAAAAAEDSSLTALLADAFEKIKSAAAMSSDDDDDSQSNESWSEEDC